MKKILIATSTLLLIILFFYACNPSGVKSSTKGEFEIPNNCLPKNLSQPLTVEEEGAIDAYLAERISQNYASDPYKGYIYSQLLASPGNETAFARRNPDSRSVWFDIRKLKSLINTIENSVCDNNCEIPVKLGIRIYFAKYPIVGPNSSENDLKTLPASYSNRHTVFFVATYDGAKGNHIDFDPMNVGNKCAPTPFKQLLANTNGIYKVSSLGNLRNIAQLTDSSVDNHGGMCPPPAGSCTFPSDY